MDEYESLSHSKGECKCHVVFIPKGPEPNQLRYPRRPRYFVKQESGGLLLLRRITPLPRRNVVYFCSGAYTCVHATASGQRAVATPFRSSFAWAVVPVGKNYR